MTSKNQAPSVDLRAFAARLPAGVTVVSTIDDQGGCTGTTMTAVMSLSMTPALFAISLDNHSNTLAAIRKSGVFVINILSDEQTGVAMLCGRKDKDGFTSIAHSTGLTRVPCLDGTAAFAECRVYSEFPAGDHTIIVGELLNTVVNEEQRPLLYHAAGFARLAEAAPAA